jgi:hypothetical protein
MLEVFHAKWHSRLPEGESLEGYDVIPEHRGSSFIPHRLEDWQEIEMLKEALRQRDDLYAPAIAQQ